MKFHKNKLLTTVTAVALTFAVGACGSSSDDDDMMSGGPPPVIVPIDPIDPIDPVLTELEKAQADAAAAAAAAMTASTDAATAAGAAMAAVANLATMQTGATSAGLAYEAHTAAGKAMAAYMDAKAASEAAAEAEVVTVAVEARIMAEAAMADAVTYGTTAMEKAGEAETAAMAELMIVGTVKSVGGTDLDAEAGSSTVTVGEGNDAQTTKTGPLKSLNPMTMGIGVANAVTGVQDDPATDEDETVKHLQAVADRTFAIGKVVDSEDDTARLMIVTKFAGSKTVKVFAYSQSATDAMLTGTKVGFVTFGVDAVLNNTPLKSVGTYYLAGEAVDNNDGLSHTDEVGPLTTAESLYSYVSVAATDEAPAVVTYVMRHETSTVGATTTYTYRRVDVDVEVVDIPDEDDTGFDTQVRATIPEAADYKHIHFGVWAALGAPAKNGEQDISDLGIGFVQSIGEGLSGTDMPNSGTADYNGNWAAAVQAEDEEGDGDISLVSGTADFKADFSKATINVNLMGLAELEGAIDTNTFSGTKATVGANDHSLTEDAKFTGSFSGGFYGKQAAEAGGIFDFTSEDAEAGAFRGAFGGDK